MFYFVVSKDGLTGRVAAESQKQATDLKMKLIIAGVACGSTLPVNGELLRAAEEMDFVSKLISSAT